MKTATITFHAAHNYGSVLQAYALQNVICSLGHENEIINFRTERQIDLYTVFTKRKGIKYFFKNASHALYYNSLKQRVDKFENFINNVLCCTKKIYTTIEELEKENFQKDCFIAGSDQIWNPIPADFDWAYYLPFVKNGRKIAYAPSFGQLASTGDQSTIQKMKTYLQSFDAISVRDQKAADNVKHIVGKDAKVVLDPTLLLSAEEWKKLLPAKPCREGEYIFFYTLFADQEIMAMVKTLSQALHLPVVVSNFSNQFDVINPFEKHYDAGPIEFLDYIYHAKFVITSSFHGTVFSTIFNRPFFSIKGNEDARISQLLRTTGLENRSVDLNTIAEKCKEAYDINFDIANQNLQIEKQRSIAYLQEILSGES